MKIIYDGKSFDHVKPPSSFTEDFNNVGVACTIAAACVVVPVATVTLGSVGCVAIAGGFAVRSGINAVKKRKNNETE